MPGDKAKPRRGDTTSLVCRPFGAGDFRYPHTQGLRPGLLSNAPLGRRWIHGPWTLCSPPPMMLTAQGLLPAHSWRKKLPADATLVLGRESPEWSAPWESFLARKHAELTVRGSKLKGKKFAGAANPIFHAGNAADSFELAPGGSFVIGRTTFTLTEGSSSPAASPNDDRPLLNERTIGHHELDRLAFRDAPHRLDVLSRLP